MEHECLVQKQLCQTNGETRERVKDHRGTMSVEMFAKRSEKFDMVAQEETTQCDRAHWDSFLGRIDEICT